MGIARSVRRTHTRLPDEVIGYAFDPAYSWWSMVVAEESSNLIINPSFERINDSDFVDEYAITGTWGEVGLENVIIAYPSVGATAGRRAARLVGATGAATLSYDNTIAVTPGGYTFSIDLYVVNVPATVTMSVRDSTGATTIAARTHTVERPGWQRLSLSYKEAATSTRTLRLAYTNAGAHTVTMYTDAWQFERKPYPTTYLDGDMMGFNDITPYSSYFWHGAPHQSVSSRRVSTGTGGRVVSWSDRIGFRTTSIVGLMLPPTEQRTQVLGNRKTLHLGMDTLARDFTITGRLFARGYGELMGRQIELQDLLLNASDDQTILRYQCVDDEQQPVGRPLDITCVYTDGLQGAITNFYQSSLAVQFRAVQPFPVDIYESSVALSMVEELVSNFIVFRDEHGEFFNLGTGATTDGIVTRVGFLADGRPVAFGNFDDLAGSGAEFGAIWNGLAWEEIPGTPSDVTDMDDGFRLGYPLTISTTAGSVHEYDPVAETWTELGAGFLGGINQLVRDENGDIWVAGEFEFAQDGITVYNNVAKWDYVAEEWQQLGNGVIDFADGMPDPLEAKAVLAPGDGFVYFAGTFEEAEYGIVQVTNLHGVVRWDIANEIYLPMGRGFDDSPNALIQGDDGFIYAVGPFTESGDTEPYDLRGFARWNGYSWEEVFPLVKPGGVYGADGIAQDADGIFWFYNVIGSIDPQDDMFVVQGLGYVPFFGWRNGVFYPPYLDDVTIRYLAVGPGNRTMHATFPFGVGEPTCKAPALNRINYEGSAPATMVAHLQGSGRLYQLLNLSTEGGVYGRDSFVMSANEEVIFRNDTQRMLVYSNQRRNLYGRLLSGSSNLAALRLIPGENRVSLLVADLDEDVSDAWLTWKNHWQGIGDGLG